ncbi:MAG: Mur ligase family protein [Planctomycetota bacterium]|nr:Mur ligase family protein [Planctomycetota bacterium]
MGYEFASSGGGLAPGLVAALEELDRLIDWERVDRSAGAPGATGLRRADLSAAHDLVERLGSPQLAFRAVHVAGTKGKGSTAALIGAGLARAGFTVGLYTSPHVERVTERIALDGEPIEDEALARHLWRALEVREAGVAEGTAAEHATWFDVLTAAAFLAFAERGVDFAVVECGLGGRLDSTNVVVPEVCVITNVDLEHTAILGNTRAEIAAEKAGIVKPGVRVVTGVPARDPAGAVIAEVAARNDAPLRFIELAGTIAERNRELAIQALGELGFGRVLDDEAERAARLPGRLERREVGGIPVVLDGAHVPASVANVLDDLGADPALHGPPVVILGLGRDKDLPGVLKALAGRVDKVLGTSVGAGPYRTPEEIVAEATRVGVAAETAVPPRMALDNALDHARSARSGEWVLVTGSLHLIGAVRGFLARAPWKETC